MSKDDDATNTTLSTPNETASDHNINQQQQQRKQHLEAQINFAQASCKQDTGESDTRMGCQDNERAGNCDQLVSQSNGSSPAAQRGAEEVEKKKEMEEDGLMVDSGSGGFPEAPMEGQQQRQQDDANDNDDDDDGRESRLDGVEEQERTEGDEVDECLHEQSTSDQLTERINISSDDARQQYYSNHNNNHQHHHHQHHQNNKRAANNRKQQQVNHPYQQHIVPVPQSDQSQPQVPTISADYLAQLIKDKKQLGAFPAVFTHLQRLIDDEINKVRQSLFQLSDVVNQNEPLELPEPEGEPVQLQEKIYVPVGEHPEYNFVGRLLGPRGMTAKQLEQETGCKIMIRGKGSMRDKKKEGQNRGKANWEHLNEELHVLITVEDTQNRAQVKLQRALEEVKQLLVPIVDGEDELKKRQLMELAIINGTYRDYNYNEALSKMLNDAVYRQQLCGEGAQQPVAPMANGSPSASQRAFAASLAAATTGHHPHHLNHQNPYMGLQVAGPNAINGSPASSGLPDTGPSTPNSMHSSGHHHLGQSQQAGPAAQHHQAVKAPPAGSAAAISAGQLPAAPAHLAGFPGAASAAIMAAAAAAAQQQQHARLAQHPSPMHTPTGTPGVQPASAPPPNHLPPSGHHHQAAVAVSAAAAAAALMAGGGGNPVGDPSALIYAQQYHEFHHHYAAMAAAAQQHHHHQQQHHHHQPLMGPAPHQGAGPPQPPPEYPGPAGHPHPHAHSHSHPHPHQQSVAAAVAQAVAQAAAAAAAASHQHHHQLHHNPYQLQAESEHQAALAYQQHVHHQHQQQHHQMETGKLETDNGNDNSNLELDSSNDQQQHLNPNHQRQRQQQDAGPMMSPGSYLLHQQQQHPPADLCG